MEVEEERRMSRWKSDDVIISDRGLNRRKRKTTTVRLDEDLLEIAKSNHLKLSDLLNHLLERWLREKGFI